LTWLELQVVTRGVKSELDRNFGTRPRVFIILHAPNLGRGWFREVRTEHPTISGRFDPSFNLTRQGFTLLVMGWNGELAAMPTIRASTSQKKTRKISISTSRAPRTRRLRTACRPAYERHGEPFLD
jgi:hypothetical protein